MTTRQLRAKRNNLKRKFVQTGPRLPNNINHTALHWNQMERK